MDTEVDIANLESKLNMEVRGKMDQQQKEYYLREKIKAIHEELGDKVDKDTEVQELRDKIKKMKLISIVQPGHRLIHHKRRTVLRQSARNQHHLALPAGKLQI